MTEGLDAIREKFANLWSSINAATSKGAKNVSDAVGEMNEDNEGSSNASWKAQFMMASKATAGIFTIVSTHSKKMFKLSKALSLAQALVALPSSVMKSFENGGGYPWGLIPAELMLATGLQQIAQLRSVTFSAAGGGASGGGGSIGGGGSVPQSSAIDPVPVVSAEERNEFSHTIRVVADDDDDFTRALADRLKVVTDNDDVVLFGEDSRQALGG